MKKLFENVAGNSFKLNTEADSKKQLWGAFYWEDPNMGYGFRGWKSFVYANTEEEAQEKLGGYNMGVGFRELKPTDVSELKKKFVKEIKEKTKLLKQLNNPTP